MTKRLEKHKALVKMKRKHLHSVDDDEMSIYVYARKYTNISYASIYVYVHVCAIENFTRCKFIKKKNINLIISQSGAELLIFSFNEGYRNNLGNEIESVKYSF